MAFVFQPDANDLIQSGWGSVAHVPVIFNNDHAYNHLANWHLRDRALGKWSPKRPYGSKPSKTTLRRYAYDLKRFIDWMEHRNLTVDDISFDKEISQFIGDLTLGRLSPRGYGLDQGYVKSLTERVCEFLQWAGENHQRANFSFSGPAIRNEAANQTGKPARSENVRANPSHLELPTHEQIAHWLKNIKITKGYPKYLASRLIIQTGMRVGEVVQLPVQRVDEIRWTWVGGYVRMDVVGKGAKKRTIDVPVALAEKLWDYRTLGRLKAAALAQQRTGAIPDQLFLSEATGAPISDQRLRDAWSTNQPTENFTPHMGRHFYAVVELLKHLNTNESKPGYNNPLGFGQGIIETHIKPQLGHVGIATTSEYLRLCVRHQSMAPYCTAWHEFLNDEVEYG